MFPLVSMGNMLLPLFLYPIGMKFLRDSCNHGQSQAEKRVPILQAIKGKMHFWV